MFSRTGRPLDQALDPAPFGRVAAAEGAELEDSGLRLIVSMAEGSVRDALSLLDQVIAGAEGTIDEAAVTAARTAATSPPNFTVTRP